MTEKTVFTEKKDSPNPEGKPAHGASHVASAKIAERPIVVNLGSARRKRIKELKNGTGKLVGKVRTAVELVAADLGHDAEGQTLLPVVVLYKEKVSYKKKRRGGPQGMCPFCCV